MAIHPRDLLLFSERQYREREEWNARCSRLQWVPPPLDDDEEDQLDPGLSLTAQEPRFLPTAFCFYDYASLDQVVCRPDSNGNAAGNTLEEAILQGLLELIERDAIAMWWFRVRGGQPRRRSASAIPISRT